MFLLNKTAAQLVALTTFIGGDSYGYQLNNAGQLAGYHADGMGARAAVYSSGGAQLNPPYRSAFLAINSAGEVTGDLGNRAVFGTAASLAELPTTNFTSMDAQGINSAGHICGIGTDVNGAHRGF